MNMEAWKEITPHKLDSLILAGDIGETDDHLNAAFSRAVANFNHVFWVPGNHELYTLPTDKTPSGGKSGEAKYLHCVEVARSHGVLTPEDEWMLWEGDGGPAIVAPCFTLYDYSFRPADVSRERALDWAREQNTEATDEVLLHYAPYASRDEWCQKLVRKFEAKFAAAREKFPDVPVIIINHWPLRQDTIYIPLVPRFSLWCGTKATEEWHKKWNAKVVVTGHLHVRRTDWIDGVRFEECSLGYPRQWKDAKESGKTVADMMREVLPGAQEAKSHTVWRKFG